jgi:hypothetical protein|tara:strand:+ start:1336 stop:2160 length:825 start_codon:yes stop_codon:yes gene_type:complete
MKGIFFLGPYGNLTTLYGNILALHPDIIGLNHGREKIPVNAQFYDGKSVKEKYDAFVKFVEDNGESFQESHTSIDGVTNGLETFCEYAADDPKYFIWKESGFLTSQIRKNNCMYKLLYELQDIVFVRPVRNPLHCLQTNLISDHYELYDDTSQGEDLGYERAKYPPALCHWYLRDLDWFLELQLMFPERFILHFENDRFEEMITKLGIPCGEQWLKQASKIAGDVRPRETAVDLAEHFQEAINLGPYMGDAFDRIREEFVAPVFPTTIPPWEVK